MSANDSGETGKFKTSMEKFNENNRLYGLFFAITSPFQDRRSSPPVFVSKMLVRPGVPGHEVLRRVNGQGYFPNIGTET
ncbi:hypothetical protein [Kaarinaea lacus]